MNNIHYVEIENFKTFGDKVRVELAHPAVLIGPNNAGKTSVVQALCLWSRGVRAWYDKKGQPSRKDSRERLSAGINRLDILEIPITDNRFLWHGARVRKGNTPIDLVVNVGIELDGRVQDCRMVFHQRDSEVLYCRPCPETVENDALLVHATGILFHLLYPMSGIETEETLLPEGRIDVLMGQGQTAQVLRNLCYKIKERDDDQKTDDWTLIKRLIDRLFSVDLAAPRFVKARGSITLSYKQEAVDRALDISVAGRGLQQTLLILAYLHLHKGSVLMIDEPDAHLEILRQRQIFEILKDVARQNGSQIVIATHSEIILEDAIETNLSLLINGEAVDLATTTDMRHTLRTFGIDHYYRARVRPRILYIEGSSDLDALRALARHLDHPALELLEGSLNCYYIRNISPEDTLEDRLDRVDGAYGDYRQHFHTLKRYVPDLRAIGIFDSDDRQVEDDVSQDLAALFWKHYEIENYFVTPEVIVRYVEQRLGKNEELFLSVYREAVTSAIDNYLLANVFSGDSAQLEEYRKASKSLRRTLLQNVKMSALAENVFQALAEQQGMPLLLRKGQFHEMVSLASPDEVPGEVVEKLDRLCEYLALPPEGQDS